MSARKIPAQGQRFGQLAFIETAGSTAAGRLLGRFICDCGAEKILNLCLVRLGTTKSCGCLRRNMVRERNTRHGEANKSKRPPEYVCWVMIKARCSRNPNNANFALYGGRGITVCGRWQVYENFLADMGRKPSPQHSIDRIDNDGNYEPDNCRWATPSEQSANQRRWQHK